MKKYIKGLLIGTALCGGFIYNAYSHFDKPIQNCTDYIEVNNLSQDVCK